MMLTLESHARRLSMTTALALETSDLTYIRDQIDRCRRLASQFDPESRRTLEAFKLQLQAKLEEIEGRTRDGGAEEARSR